MIVVYVILSEHCALLQASSQTYVAFVCFPFMILTGLNIMYTRRAKLGQIQGDAEGQPRFDKWGGGGGGGLQ